MLSSVLPAVIVQTDKLVGSVACMLTCCIPVDISGTIVLLKQGTYLRLQI